MGEKDHCSLLIRAHVKLKLTNSAEETDKLALLDLVDLIECRGTR
jgi:hypothetical protein